MTQSLDESDLLPCPFCGNSTNFLARGIDGMPYCGDCGAQSGLLDWNERATPAREAADDLVEALLSIKQYGTDTLSGRADGPDDRKWQRDGVREMTNRAVAALARARGAA